jgi:hypothetical protein
MTEIRDHIALPISYVERLVAVADTAGVKQGVDIVGPHDTVIVETVKGWLERAAPKGGRHG